MSARSLFLDIETSPITAHVWGLRDQHIALNQIMEGPRVLAVGSKWGGAKRPMWRSEYHQSRDEMLQHTWGLLDAADIVYHFNGNGFDIPWLNGEFVKEGMTPPSPFKSIDLYRVARKNFRFPSYKLQFIVGHLLGDSKVQHQGHGLWVDCMYGDEDTKRKAWALFRRYCLQDVNLLEPLAEKLQPWFPATVNMAVYAPGDGPACQKCGSANLESRGVAYTAQRAYPQYRCNECGGWTRDTKSSWGIDTAGVVR